jgi:hypothetical protein
MTTIAYDGKTLATDSQLSCQNLKFGTVPKIFDLKDGSVGAFCGDYEMVEAIINWLNGDAEKPEPNEKYSASGIMIPKDGSGPIEITCRYNTFKTCTPWAGGSGDVIALTAMKCGKSAIEAVEIACELDMNSGGPVQSRVIARQADELPHFRYADQFKYGPRPREY